MPYITKLTKSGQMTLPKPVREVLKAKPGSQLRVELKDGQAVISVQLLDDRLKQIRKNSVAHLKQQGLYGLSEQELKEAITKEKASYYGQKYKLS